MSKTKPTISADHLKRIAEIAPLARLARRQHAEDDPKVLASKELTTLFKTLALDQGVGISNIARSAGMTYHSVSARVKSENK